MKRAVTLFLLLTGLAAMLSAQKKEPVDLVNPLVGTQSKFSLSTGNTYPGKEFATITNNDHLDKGEWMVMFWWPKDFTFVCPTEIAGFEEYANKFKELSVSLIGASTDSEFVHLAWRNNHPALKNLSFPMLADTSKSLAEELGILEQEEKIAYRTTFIVDPTGTIRHVSVNDLQVGRNIQEIIRVVEALQTGELTPCNWKKGEKTL